MTCQACQARLPEYAEAIAEERASSADLRAVTLHLALCPHCLAAYTDLAQLVALATGRAGAEPPAYPEPALSFLGRRAAVPARRRWRLDELGQIVITFSADLLGSLQIQPGFAPAGLKSEATTEPPRSFILDGEIDDATIAIVIEAGRGDPSRYTVVARVEIPSRGGWPNLGGTLVILRRGDSEIERQITDAFGNATFERIAAPDLERLVFVINRLNEE